MSYYGVENHAMETRPYLITHAPCCGCIDADVPATAQTPRAVAAWFWGRDVTCHTVYAGEIPYHFQAAASIIDRIAWVLDYYPPWFIRKELLLPLNVRLKNSSSSLVEDICLIGDSAHLRTSFFWPLWLLKLRREV